MENLIESRVILGILCLIHVFAIYGSKCPWGHIKGKVLNTIIITELIAVSAYILYDNLQTPPRDGWFLAILGYILVYVLILMTWAVYSIFTILDKDKVYEMTITHRVHFMNEDYFEGTVLKDDIEIKVLLPYSQELYPITEETIKQKVMFDNVIYGNILVKSV